MTMLVVAAAGMVLASVVGGMTGFATSLLATPMLLLVGFDVPAVVVINLVATMVSRIAALVGSWRLVDRTRVLLLGAGSLPGAVGGLLTAGLLDTALLKRVSGVVVALLGLYLLLRRPRAGSEPGRGATVGVGVVGGFLSTSISLNGPPVAILLSRAGLAPARFVADFAGYFVLTNAISLAVLGVGGRIPTAVLWPAVPVLALAAVVGNQVGARFTDKIPQDAFRTAVNLLVIASGVVTAVT